MTRSQRKANSQVVRHHPYQYRHGYQLSGGHFHFNPSNDSRLPDIKKRLAVSMHFALAPMSNKQALPAGEGTYHP